MKNIDGKLELDFCLQCQSDMESFELNKFVQALNKKTK